MIFIRYFGEVLESAVNPLFFRKAVRHSAMRAFGYYLFFTTVYTLAVCGAGVWWLSQQWSPVLDKVQSYIPPVEVSLEKGVFFTTLPQPAVFGDREFAFIVDTGGEVEDISEYDSAFVVEKTKAVMKKDRFETREYHFAEIPDFQLTTDDAIAWLKGHEQPILWSLFAAMGLVVIPMFWLFLIPVIMVLMLLMMIPARIIRSNLGYSQVLAIGFYGVTFPTLLETYFLFQGRTGGDSTFRWIYLIWCFVGVIAARTSGSPPAGSGAPLNPAPSTPA